MKQLSAKPTAMRRIVFSRRNAVVFVVFVVFLAVCAVYRYVPESYAGTKYWVPRSTNDEKQLKVTLHWKPGQQPIVRSEGCSKDMSIDDPTFDPSDIRISELSNLLTIVTGYFHIPEYRKAALCWFCNQTTRNLYRQWMTSFALIENPVIAFIDNDEDFEYFRAIRRHVDPNLTCLIRVDRTRMWAFSEKNRQRVRNITDSDGYLHFYPNTVIPDYSLTQNAKYEVMQMSIRRNPYRTRYIAWLDIGLFRAITTPLITSRTSSGELKVQPPSGQSRFRLDLPPRFNANRSIAFSETFLRDSTLTPKAVIFRIKVWVCGAYFVGRLDHMYRWTQDYLRSYEWLIKNNLTNTDEQVIYAAHNAIDQGILKPFKTILQPYERDSRYSEYFNVGYQSRVMLDTAAVSGAATSRTMMPSSSLCIAAVAITVYAKFV